ncbi:flavin reductase family protein [Catenulispora rubra]|uniref:flavin reductase family protein n=1 Tax=Catenulispora rubra TaxID=280293 RepID=UPI002B26679A|nr:flavin reductase family protein [Catenulispora rubra]
MSVIGTAGLDPEPTLRDRLPSGLHAPADLRSCFGMFATGITVVSAGGPNPCGMTANSFTSVSLDPPLVLVCIVHDAAMHKAILGEGSFAISVLAAHQEPVARHFANRDRPRGEREFEAVRWQPGPVTGAPVVADTLAWIECGLAAVYDGGDHSIFVGSVLDMGKGGAGDALLFFRGGYHRLEPGTSK